ncbi:MAG TPA: hypothetical protein VN812_20420 [Candidatus Acidoferrales bacterium]|nr:hypothetical protein [Candidatus Acidoferrales bacterium]
MDVEAGAGGHAATGLVHPSAEAREDTALTGAIELEVLIERERYAWTDRAAHDGRRLVLVQEAAVIVIRALEGEVHLTLQAQVLVEHVPGVRVGGSAELHMGAIVSIDGLGHSQIDATERPCRVDGRAHRKQGNEQRSRVQADTHGAAWIRRIYDGQDSHQHLLVVWCFFAKHTLPFID